MYGSTLIRRFDDPCTSKEHMSAKTSKNLNITEQRAHRWNTKNNG
jgi:hypothetical protein